MKKILFFFLAVLSAAAANAQSTDYRAFKVDLGLGYAIPSSGNGTKAGVVFAIEPHYRLSNDFAVGLRFEGAGLGSEDNTNGDESVKVSLLTSYTLTGDYYLTKSRFRVFAGGGLGLFVRRSVVDASNSDETVSAGGTKFGAFPRLGFEAGHFRFSTSYNIVGSNASYLSFTVGAFFGGGRKK